jgi:hypothetical protein
VCDVAVMCVSLSSLCVHIYHTVTLHTRIDALVLKQSIEHILIEPQRRTLLSQAHVSKPLNFTLHSEARRNTCADMPACCSMLATRSSSL